MDIMFIETNGNNFLPSILITLLVVPLSNDILFARIVLSVILPMILLIVFYWTSKKLYNNSKYAILALIITSIWLTTYRLSSDLHRTMIAFILIVPIFYLYNIGNPNFKNRFCITLLIFIASFSQIEVAILFGGAIFLLEIWRILRSRKIEKDKVINLIVVLSSIIPAFIITVSYSTHFISVAIVYPVSLKPPTIVQIFMYLGGFLIPLTLIGILFIFYDLLADLTFFTNFRAILSLR